MVETLKKEENKEEKRGVDEMKGKNGRKKERKKWGNEEEK